MGIPTESKTSAVGINHTPYLVSKISDFIKNTGSELPIQDAKFAAFLRYAVPFVMDGRYRSNDIRELNYIERYLIPLEASAMGRFHFVFDSFQVQSEGNYYPTMQVSTNFADYDALIMQRSDLPLPGCNLCTSVPTPEGTLQLGQLRNRIPDSIDLKAGYPELHAFKDACSSNGIPIIYLLGAARQFPARNSKHAQAVAWQSAALEQIFKVSEERHGDGVVFGTGGWAGTHEKSLGVPRLGYLAARERGLQILTTIPRCGAYDMHEHSTLEVVCGEYWGDDSPVLAAMSDGAFVFGSYGNWTEIEIQNLRRQDKPFVVLENPDAPLQAKYPWQYQGNTRSRRSAVFSDPAAAAHQLFDEMETTRSRVAKVQHGRELVLAAT